MIAADTSAWIDYSKGRTTTAAQQLEQCIIQGVLVLPLPVFFEVLSGPGLTKEASFFIRQLPKLELLGGFWERAAYMRNKILKKRMKARSMDCLIAQNCIDHDVALVVSDQDYRHFIKFGLKLL